MAEVRAGKLERQETVYYDAHCGQCTTPQRVGTADKRDNGAMVREKPKKFRKVLSCFCVNLSRSSVGVATAAVGEKPGRSPRSPHLEESTTVYYSVSNFSELFNEEHGENTAPGVSARGPPGKDLASIARRSSSVKRRLSEVIRRISSGFLGAAPASHLTDEDFMRLSPITGSWEVDRSRSDDYSSLVKLMKLGWAFSKALENSKTLHFHVAHDKIHSTAKIFNMVELRDSRPWSGEKIQTRRKDLRKGGAWGWVEKTARGFTMRSEWGEPLAGETNENIALSDDKESLHLTKTTTLKSGGESIVKIVFRRTTRN